MNNVIRDRADFLRVQEQHHGLVSKREELMRKLNCFLSVAQTNKELQALREQAAQKIEALSLHMELLKTETDEGRLVKAREDLDALLKQRAAIQAELDSIKAELGPLTTLYTNCIKNAGEMLKKFAADHTEAEKAYKKSESQYRMLVEEREATIREHAELETQVQIIRQEVEKLDAEKNTVLLPEVEALKANLAKEEKTLDQLRTELHEFQAKEESAGAEKRCLKNRQEEIEREITELETAQSTKKEQRARAKEQAAHVAQALAGAEKEVDALMANCDQTVLNEIVQQYKKLSPNDLLAALAEDIQKQSKERVALQMRLDKKCIDSLAQVEAEFSALNLNHQKVAKERAAVAELIENIEQQKMKKLQTSFTRADQMFTNIFSTLLPGATAHISKNSEDFSEGLELIVEFNGVRKKGLHDLSGGQRSLLALSLLLAFLKLNVRKTMQYSLLSLAHSMSLMKSTLLWIAATLRIWAQSFANTLVKVNSS